MKTLYEQWLKLKTNDERMKFYFKHSIKYKSYKTRSVKEGIYLYIPFNKTYAEITYNGQFIDLYPVYDNGIIGKRNGEIVLENFIDSLMENYKLIKG